MPFVVVDSEVVAALFFFLIVRIERAMKSRGDAKVEDEVLCGSGPL